MICNGFRSVTYHIRRTLLNTTQKSCSIITCHGYWSLSSLLIVVVIVIDRCHCHWSPSSSLIVVTSSIVIVIVIVVLRPNYNCCSHIMNSQDENHNSHHNEEKMVKNIDWKCRYCSYTNNEEVSWAVFGDDDCREGARICIICYKYCARSKEDTRGYETRG